MKMKNTRMAGLASGFISGLDLELPERNAMTNAGKRRFQKNTGNPAARGQRAGRLHRAVYGAQHQPFVEPRAKARHARSNHPEVNIFAVVINERCGRIALRTLRRSPQAKSECAGVRS